MDTQRLNFWKESIEKEALARYGKFLHSNSTFIMNPLNPRPGFRNLFSRQILKFLVGSNFEVISP